MGRFLPVVTKQRPGQITCKWFVKSVQLSRIDVHFARLAGVPILGIGRWPFHSDGLLTNWHFNDRQRFRWPLRRSKRRCDWTCPVKSPAICVLRWR